MTRVAGFTEANVPDLSGKCFVVTGANAGIGFEITRVLSARGARVLLACRDRGKAEDVMNLIAKMTAKADVEFLALDQSDLESVRSAADVIAEEARIDGLINNAGVMTPPLTRTGQGHELQFGVNHLGTFALSLLLLPKLQQTPGARIVVTSSIAHRGAVIDWDDLDAKKSYSRMERYAASKLANALFFFELDRRLRAAGSPVISVGCHPGMAQTSLGRHMGPLQVLNPLVGLFLNDAARGAWPALQAATGNVVPGGYYGPIGFRGVRGVSGEASRSDEAMNTVWAKRLWEVSVALTGVDPGLPA